MNPLLADIDRLIQLAKDGLEKHTEVCTLRTLITWLSIERRWIEDGCPRPRETP